MSFLIYPAKKRGGMQKFKSHLPWSYIEENNVPKKGGGVAGKSSNIFADYSDILLA